MRGIKIKDLQSKAKRVLKDLGCLDRELTVLFTNDRTIQKYHQQYLGSPEPTNVMAFPPTGPCHRESSRLWRGDVAISRGLLRPFGPRNDKSILGDVIISLETAQREARSAGVRLEERLVYLMIHAVLHLLGYDHDRPGAKTLKMRRMEKRLFRRVGGSTQALRNF